MSVSQSPESESQSPNPAGDESGQINRPTKAETLRRRAAYAFGNLGQSAFYNALSTYFVVYVTSVLFVNVEKALATKLIALITSLIVIIRIAEIFLDPLLGNLVDNTNTRFAGSARGSSSAAWSPPCCSSWSTPVCSGWST